MSNTILVTGATGTVGSRVVQALARVAGVSVRAGVRNVEAYRRKGGLAAGATPVAFDYTDPAILASALKGVDRVFVLTPLSPDQVELGESLLRSVRGTGVRHLVKLSAIGCEIEPGIQLGRWHRALERRIEASGIPYTFVRTTNFMDNFVHYYPPTADGSIYLPLGDGAVSYIDARDVAAAVAAALTSDGHEGKAYAITGGEALTVAQVAAHIAEVTGRTIRYIDVPEADARRQMLGSGAPPWLVDSMMELHAIARAGYLSAVSPAVKELTGRQPRTFPEFARDHATAWPASKG